MIVLCRLAKGYEDEKRLKFLYDNQNLRELVNRGVSPCAMVYFMTVGLLSRDSSYEYLPTNTLELLGDSVFQNNPHLANFLIDCIEQAQTLGYGLGTEYLVADDDRGEFGCPPALVLFGKLLLCLAKYFDPSMHKNLTKNQLLLAGSLFSNYDRDLFSESDWHPENRKNTPLSIIEEFNPTVTVDQLIEVLKAQPDRRSKAFALKYKLHTTSNDDYGDFIGSFLLTDFKQFTQDHLFVLLNDMCRRLKESKQNLAPAILLFFEKINNNAAHLSDDLILEIVREFLSFSRQFSSAQYVECWREVFTIALQNPHIQRVVELDLKETMSKVYRMPKAHDVCKSQFPLATLTDVTLLGLFIDYFPFLLSEGNFSFTQLYLRENKGFLDKKKHAQCVGFLLVKSVEYDSCKFFGISQDRESFLHKHIAEIGMLPVKFFELYFDNIFKKFTPCNAINVYGEGILHALAESDKNGCSGARELMLRLWHENGANFNITNAHGYTPLYVAVRHFCSDLGNQGDVWKKKMFSVIQHLIEYGADPNFKVQGNMSPVEYVNSRKTKSAKKSSAIEELKRIMCFADLEKH
jgi:hypothetical protein